MGILEYILGTIQGQREYNDNEMLEEDSTILGQYDDNLDCEHQIIKCQITNDRLLGSTSKALRKKYGNSTVDRAIQRLSQRRKRGKCSRKAEIEKGVKFFKPLIDSYFNKKTESEFGTL